MVASGVWSRYTTPLRNIWHLLHWSGVIKTSARVGEGAHFSNDARRARRFFNVCVFYSVVRPHAYTDCVFLLF
jgi:hypothetical protein